MAKGQHDARSSCTGIRTVKNSDCNTLMLVRPLELPIKTIYYYYFFATKHGRAQAVASFRSRRRGMAFAMKLKERDFQLLCKI